MADAASSAPEYSDEIVVYSKKKAKGVQLFVGGSVFSRWTTIDVTRSIETIAGTFDLTLAQPGPVPDAFAPIKPGASCRVAVDGQTVITGHIDDVAVSYDSDSHSINVKGRDATGDLVDCSAPFDLGDFAGRNPLDIITQIAKPFGISVRSDISPLSTLPVYVVQPGESAFETISQVAAYAAVLPISDGMGGLVLTRSARGPSFAPIALGTNILSAGGRFSAKERFSQYTVIGQGQSDVVPFSPTPSPYQLGQASDPGVTRYRPLVIMADFNGPEDSWQRRATWEMAVRAGRAYREDITVKGWRDAKGALWQPNGTTRVDDGWVGFGDTLVIAGVKFAISEKGEITTVSVTRRQAFDLIPQALGSQYQDPASSGQRGVIQKANGG